MEPFTFALLTFLIVAGAMFLTGVLLLQWWPTVSRDRLMAPAAPLSAGSILRWDTARAGWQRAVERLGRAAGPRDVARTSKLRQRLTWAGFHDPRAIPLFFGVKVGAAILCGLLYPLGSLLTQRVVPHPVVVSLVLAALGILVPDVWLRRRIRARQEEILNALPDVLDLLTVCVEAGLGFDAAMARVAEQPEMQRSPLHQEILRVNLEIRAGRPRQEALRALADRCGVQDIDAMVSVFVQTDRLGTSMGKALRVHADTSRVQRRHRAEERAYVAPLKMIFPTVLFLMPAFLLVALAPSLLMILNLMSQAAR